MNKQLIRVLAGVLLVVAAAGCKKPKALGATVPANFVSHSSSGFVLKTPPTWKETAGLGSKVSFAVLADDGICNLNVTIVPQAMPNRDAGEIAKQVEAGVTKQQVTNFALKTAENVLVAGEDAPRIVYDGTAMGMQFRWQQVMVSKGGKTYIITFTAPVASYDKYAPTIDQILESMQIK